MSLKPRPLKADRYYPALPDNVGQRIEQNQSSSTPEHRLIIGSSKVSLDLRSGVGYEENLNGTGIRLLSPAESRLVLLDWTRSRTPKQAPDALWVIEAGALAANGSAPPWREWAMHDLHAALHTLLNSAVTWTDVQRDTLQKVLEAAAKDPTTVDLHSLNLLVRGLADFVNSRGTPPQDTIPAPVTLSGCHEVEWDRVGTGVDLGELGLRSKVFDTVWITSIAQTETTRRRSPAQLWARLVDDLSGAIYDEVQMNLSGSIWCARGYVPPAARTTATRVDLTADPGRPARPREAREHILMEQKWFRTLHFARSASISAQLAVWAEEYRRRLGDGAPAWIADHSSPFLAERHLRPTDIASARSISA